MPKPLELIALFHSDSPGKGGTHALPSQVERPL